jgi:hypothetical protein
MTGKLTLLILDDNIPISQEYVERSVYDQKIDSESLSELARSANWRGEHNLQRLILDLLDSRPFQDHRIDFFGYTHPEICLSDVEAGLRPDIIVYDWEYGAQGYIDSSRWLGEFFDKTGAFVFVYSNVRNEIPPFLNKAEFNNYAKRFQLFLKGESGNTVYSSEEFILQYILSRLEKSTQITVQGVKIDFSENGYLRDPSDILYLESILGRKFLMTQIESLGRVIDNSSIENIIGKFNGILLFDPERRFLVAPDHSILVDKFQLKPENNMTYLEALKRFGLIKLKEALEAGIAKV